MGKMCLRIHHLNSNLFMLFPGCRRPLLILYKEAASTTLGSSPPLSFLHLITDRFNVLLQQIFQRMSIFSASGGNKSAERKDIKTLKKTLKLNSITIDTGNNLFWAKC